MHFGLESDASVLEHAEIRYANPDRHEPAVERDAGAAVFFNDAMLHCAAIRAFELSGLSIAKRDIFKLIVSVRAEYSAARGFEIYAANGSLANLVAIQNASDGIYIQGSVELRNATAVDNLGVGIKGVNSPTLTNCISWNNAQGNYSGFDESNAAYSNGGFEGGVGNIDQDPLFVDSASGECWRIDSLDPNAEVVNGRCVSKFHAALNVDAVTRVLDRDQVCQGTVCSIDFEAACGGILGSDRYNQFEYVTFRYGETRQFEGTNGCTMQHCIIEENSGPGVSLNGWFVPIRVRVANLGMFQNTCI